MLAMLAGCSTLLGDWLSESESPTLVPRQKYLAEMLPLDGPPIPIAVYGFLDKTGQKKTNDRLALFSSAVTQGAEVFLIKALHDTPRWFTVVERVGLDNLIKERQLIRNQREVYEGKEAKPLKPLLVAGLMLEGGIIGYDTNIRSGGSGARMLGIGSSVQYRVDEIIVSLRLISVSTGEVLINVSVNKTVYSASHNIGVLKFIDAGTTSVELENGAAINEPTTYAVRIAIEQAVYEMIQEGIKRKLWKTKGPGPRSATGDNPAAEQK
jgi:curli production assembly/transport component CsgG